MKKTQVLIMLLLILNISCRKDQQEVPPQPLNSSELEKVKASYTGSLKPDWSQAEQLEENGKTYWSVPLSGSPVNGYRKLLLYKDSTRILEILPDPLYWQHKGRVDTADFTGRLFRYDETYHLLFGSIYIDGKLAGQIKRPEAGSHLHTDNMKVEINCTWYDSSYIDGEGVFVVYSEKICTSTSYDDAASNLGAGTVSTGPSSGGGGGGGSSNPSAPPVANLPGEQNAKINPAAYMNCFKSLPDAGSKMTVTVYVQEPQPGLPFNVGTNSVGHTAIALTKTYKGQTVTQIVGFYPDATGKNKLHAPSKVVDNGDLKYTVSISYPIIATQFNKVAAFISKPPNTYDLTSFNCTNFVNSACAAGGIKIPDPVGNMGLGQTGMTPGALGGSIRNLAPDKNVDTQGGRTAAGHGPCNSN